MQTHHVQILHQCPEQCIGAYKLPASAVKVLVDTLTVTGVLGMISLLGYLIYVCTNH